MRFSVGVLWGGGEPLLERGYKWFPYKAVLLLHCVSNCVWKEKLFENNHGSVGMPLLTCFRQYHSTLGSLLGGRRNNRLYFVKSTGKGDYNTLRETYCLFFHASSQLTFSECLFLLSIVLGARYDLKANPFCKATSKNFERKKMKQNLHFQIIT